MGYENVMVYKDGIIGWAKAGNMLASNTRYPEKAVPLVSADELISADPDHFFIVDIRPDDHFARGHIRNSVHIDLETLHEQLERLPAGRDIVLVDHKGKLTLTTGRYLYSQGYSDIYRLDGGFNAWVKYGFPVTVEDQ